MNGYIALLGSGEYLPVMDEADKFLLANCGAKDKKPKVVCLPTAAGQEGDSSVNRWMKMGVDHFTRLGADVESVPVTDKETANEPKHASAVEEADVVYFSGGNPMYLYQTMKDSLVWKSAMKVFERGGVYAGCSAGAMILGKEMPNFRMLGLNNVSAFGYVPAVIIPHFDATPLFFKPIISAARARLKKNDLMIGIDENTALVGKNGEWTVMGKAGVHVFAKHDSKSYAVGEKFSL
ncbi:MAG: cyanophycinase [Anaerolineales bacterium]